VLILKTGKTIQLDANRWVNASPQAAVQMRPPAEVRCLEHL